jgi:hypothetical protein
LILTAYTTRRDMTVVGGNAFRHKQRGELKYPDDVHVPNIGQHE